MKPFSKFKDKVDDEAMKRAKKIDDVSQKFLDLLVEAELTVNDSQVIIQQLTQQFQTVFLSRQVNDFMDKKA